MMWKRFGELVNGPLYHPIASLAILRLVGALGYVVDATGQAGEAALERYCRMREERDRELSTAPRSDS